jgi:hypothetical protein
VARRELLALSARRPALSRRLPLNFGSNRLGSFDIFVAERRR